MSKSALVVLDMQVGIFTLLDPPLADPEELLHTIAILVRTARAEAIPIVFVQHNTGTALDGTDLWQIHPTLTPLPHELVLQKHTLDAFADTSLHQHLQQTGITDLVVCGVQTEYCITTTAQRAVQLGYHVTLVQDGHGTCDTPTQTASVLKMTQEQLLKPHVHLLPAQTIVTAWIQPE